MGLSQAGNSAKPRRLRGTAAWLLPAALVLSGGLAAILGEDGLILLRYEREAINAGEFWRLLSGHFVHLGWGHYWLNAAGLILVWFLVGHALTPLQWLGGLAGIIVGIDAGFWFLDPQLAWYVGLSGALHGLLVGGLLVTWREAPGENLLVLGLIAAKLTFEQIVGPLPGSESAAGGSVVVNAHLYGAVAGAVLAIAYRIRVRTAPAI